MTSFFLDFLKPSYLLQKNILLKPNVEDGTEIIQHCWTKCRLTHLGQTILTAPITLCRGETENNFTMANYGWKCLPPSNHKPTSLSWTKYDLEKA